MGLLPKLDIFDEIQFFCCVQDSGTAGPPTTEANQYSDTKACST